MAADDHCQIPPSLWFLSSTPSPTFLKVSMTSAPSWGDGPTAHDVSFSSPQSRYRCCVPIRWYRQPNSVSRGIMVQSQSRVKIVYWERTDVAGVLPEICAEITGMFVWFESASIPVCRASMECMAHDPGFEWR